MRKAALGVVLAVVIAAPMPMATSLAAAAGPSIFLPNVTKTLGGPGGWTTPVAVQNTGEAPTAASLTLYRFSDGSPVATVASPTLKPGQTWLFDPVAYANVPGDAQFSIVVQPQAGELAAVVLEGSGPSWMAYQGTRAGASTVYLPNVTRRLGGPDGWETPFIVQNLAAAPVTASVLFYRFRDSALAKRIDNVTLQPGRARPFIPAQIDGLQDDAQYAVVVQGPPGSQLYAVVNEHQGAQAMSYEGLLAGAETIYLPNVTKFLGGTNAWSTPFVVQNVGAAPTTFSLAFHSFASGALAARVDNLALQPGRSFPVDVRSFPATLAPGQYSVVVRGAPGAKLGAVVNQHEFSAGMAMSYLGIAAASPSAYVPYVQRSNDPARWSSPIVAQNLGPSPSDLTLTIFDAGGEVVSQKVFRAVAPGAAAVYDPRADPALNDGVYSALVQAAAAVAAVVNHSAVIAGDYAMSFTSAPAAARPIPASPPPVTVAFGGITFKLTYTLHADVYVESGIATDEAQTIVAAADGDVARIQDAFARTFTGRALIYAFATTTSYVAGLTSVLKLRAEHIAGASRAAGIYSGEARAIALDWERLRAAKPFTAARHELSHLMVNQITGARHGAVPAWLDEGTARLEEFTADGTQWFSARARYAAASMAASGQLFSLADLTSREVWVARSGPQSEYQYHAAAQAVQFLRDDLGRASVVRIFDLIAQGQPFTTAYATVSARRFEDFAAAYPQRVRALAASYPGIATAPDTWVGPGIALIFYGFVPSTSVSVTISLPGYEPSRFARTVDSYGVMVTWIPKDWRIGTYSITAAGANGTVAISTAKTASALSWLEGLAAVRNRTLPPLPQAPSDWLWR